MSDQIDRLPGVDATRIREDYLTKSRPVIVQDFFPVTGEAWSLNELRAKFGEHKVRLVAYKPGFRDGVAYEMTLARYVDCLEADNFDSWWLEDYDAPYLARWDAVERRDTYPEVFRALRAELRIPDAFQGFNSGWPRVLRPGCEVHLFVGPRGARSYLHRDALMTHAWMTNFEGTKRWTLFAPEDARYLYPTGGISPIDAEDPDLSSYPEAAKARPITVDVGPGETMIVPAGWWHQVTSLTATFSITGNFVLLRDLPGYLGDIARHAPLTAATTVRRALAHLFVRGQHG